MIAERSLAQAAHVWGAHGVPFNDQPKSELFCTASLQRATTLLEPERGPAQPHALERGKRGRQVRHGRPLARAPWNPKPTFGVCITQASLTGIGLLGLFLQKLGKAPRHQHSANLKLLEEAFSELSPPRAGVAAG